jgi:hypothetical protein
MLEECERVFLSRLALTGTACLFVHQFNRPTVAVSSEAATKSSVVTTMRSPRVVKSLNKARSNSWKLYTLFEYYMELHGGVLPDASRWEAQLRPLAKKKGYDFHAIVQRPMSDMKSRFVMNQAASGLNTNYLSDGESFIIFFELPVNRAGKYRSATLNSVRQLPHRTDYLFGAMSGNESLCPADEEPGGPCIARTSWFDWIRSDIKITSAVRWRMRNRIKPRVLVTESD